MSEDFYLGEGNTSLIQADQRLREFAGISNLLFKNETQNPTWSFKDRGSLTCIFMAKKMGEKVTATISSGNMVNSIAAYGAKAGIKVIVFVPEFTPKEKIMAMSIHGAIIIKVKAEDYSMMKKHILSFAKKLKLRIVSGNGPIRVEGYKLTSFEMFQQMENKVPDYIAVPTSACGNVKWEEMKLSIKQKDIIGSLKVLPKKKYWFPKRNLEKLVILLNQLLLPGRQFP
jgi:threonine synthase